MSVANDKTVEAFGLDQKAARVDSLFDIEANSHRMMMRLRLFRTALALSKLPTH